jgi:putative ABC transport system permease protein
MEILITRQFFDAERQNVSVSFAEPLAPAARHALARLPGVLVVEAQRDVPVRLSSRQRHRYLSVTGVSGEPRLKRILDRNGNPVTVPDSGLVLSQRLAEILNVTPGDTVTIEVLESQRPVFQTLVAGTVDDTMGLAAYMNAGALHRLLREGDTLSSAALLVDPAAEPELSGTLKRMPTVAGAAFKQRMLENFRDILSRNMNLMIGMNLLFAGIIAAGVVYNAARVSLSERSRDLASLRVLGFRKSEVSMILLGELAILTIAALPLGAAFGYVLSRAIAGTVDSEVYRFPLVVTPQSIAWAFLAVIVASAASGLLVRRKLDSLDLVAVLKARD